jgi:hypothetical protein
MKKYWNEYKDIIIVTSICVAFGIGCYTFINNTWFWHMGLLVDKSNAQIQHK